MTKPEFTFTPTDMSPKGNCEVPLQSTMIVRLLKALRYKFSTTENIIHEELKPIIWNEDPSLTKLLITSSFKTSADENTTDIFPRLVVGAQKMGVPLPTRPGLATAGLSRTNMHLGVPETATLQGSIIINVVSRGDYEALLLGEDVYMWLLYLGRPIMKDLNLSSFDITVLSGPSASEQYKDCYTASIGIDWSAGIVWRTAPDGPVFSDVKIN